MPTTAALLRGLHEITNGAIGLAVVWHVVLAIVVLALVLGWRPVPRVARLLIALPLASVGVVAFAFGNPVNGTIFAAAAVALYVIGMRTAARRAHAPAPIVAVGALAIAFGWLYPHFLDQPAMYLIAAPFGLLPCPTLSVVIGFALLGGGFTSRAWSVVLAGLGLVYGVFGVARLGVTLDLPLIGFAAVLAAVGLADRARLAHTPAAFARRM